MVNHFGVRIESDVTATASQEEFSGLPRLVVKSGERTFVRQIASSTDECRCPTCRSIVYSRRHRLCGVCSQPLPEEYLFTISEARRIQTRIESERQRHRRWLAESFQP